MLKPGAAVAEAHVQDVIRGQGAVEAGRIPQINVRILELAPERQAAVLEALGRNPNVAFAEPDWIVPHDAVVDDPYFGNQWHLPKIAAPTAWETTVGLPGVIVAILDTGVDGTHPDLAAKLVPGWNVYDNNSDTTDVYGHGTKTAGSAAAIGNNAAGVAGVAYACGIMPIRISDLQGYASSSSAASGLTWAADHGARVANISYSMTPYSVVADAANYLRSKGGVVTVSAGNNGSLLTTSDSPSLITVSATDSNDGLASWSNRGPLVDLSAPGVGIYTTTRGGGYGSVSGTSFSAPIVAGVAALVISANPTLNASQIEQILESTALDLGVSGWDEGFGWGRVAAAAAVAEAVAVGVMADTTSPSVQVLSPASGETVSGLIGVEASATDNVAVASVTFKVDGVTLGTLSEAPYSWTWDSALVADGVHRVSALAIDTAGNASEKAVDVSVSNFPDLTAPNITITSPKDGQTISKNNLSVTVSTSDDRGVVQVDLYVDGELRATSTRSPFTTTWNTRTASRGTHTLQCVASDAAGNAGVSAVVAVVK